MNQNYQILAANGDWFQLDAACGGTATFLGNVFELTGVGLPGETFVIFGAGANGTNEYAGTTLGNIYRWDGCSSSMWSYIGAIPDSPTPAQQSSFGGVKVRYR